jgi:hypothetical protein
VVKFLNVCKCLLYSGPKKLDHDIESDPW